MISRPMRYGLLAEFATAEQLGSAVEAAYAAGYRHLEAYSPQPVPALYRALRLGRTAVAPLVFCGGLLGCVGGYFLQYYLNVMSYPINVGGRPLHSWPSFIPVTFELTILCAALTAIISLFALNGLPQLDHPVFTVPSFTRATRDRFFLLIESIDPLFSLPTTRSFLLALLASEVTDVETPYPYQLP